MDDTQTRSTRNSKIHTEFGNDSNHTSRGPVVGRIADSSPVLHGTAAVLLGCSCWWWWWDSFNVIWRIDGSWRSYHIDPSREAPSNAKTVVRNREGMGILPLPPPFGGGVTMEERSVVRNLLTEKSFGTFQHHDSSNHHLSPDVPLLSFHQERCHHGRFRF